MTSLVNAESDKTITGVGRIASALETRHLAAQRDAIIQKVHVSTGQRVAAGELLVTLDCAELEAQLKIAEARYRFGLSELEVTNAPTRIQQVEAQRALLLAGRYALDEHTLRLKREQELAGKGFVSSQDLDSLQFEVSRREAMIGHLEQNLAILLAGARREVRDRARASAELDREGVRGAQTSIDTCRLRSPIDGTVLRVYKWPGEHSQASLGKPVLAIADLSDLTVEAEIDELDAFRLQAGQIAKVWINGGDERFQGFVKTVSQITGRREARSFDPGDRFDREVVETVLSGFEGSLPPIIGLRVVVSIDIQ